MSQRLNTDAREHGPAAPPEVTLHTQPEPTLPEYQSHKRVRAARIAALEIHHDGSATIVPVDGGIPRFQTGAGWASRYKGDNCDREGERDRGYFVQYEDGYQSWSPSEAFEGGYTRIECAERASEGHQQRVPVPSNEGQHAPCDRELRMECLSMALGASAHGEPDSDTLDRARKYLDFVRGADNPVKAGD